MLTIQLLAVCAIANTATPAAADGTAKPPPAVVTTTALTASTIPAAPAKSKDQELWDQLRQAEMTGTSRTLADWAVINGMPLAPKVEGIDAEFSAVASVLMLLDIRQPASRPTMDYRQNRAIPPLDDGDSRGRIATKIRYGGTTTTERQQLVEQDIRDGGLERFFDEENERSDKQEKDNWRIWDTWDKRLTARNEPAIVNATTGMMLVSNLRELGSTPTEAIKNYWEQRWQTCGVRKGKVSVKSGRLLLDNGIPFIVKNDGRTWVCFGYGTESKGSGFFLAADSAKVEYIKKVTKFSYQIQDTSELLHAAWGDGQVHLYDQAVSINDGSLPPFCTFLSWPCEGEMIILSQPAVNVPEINKWVK